MPCGPLRLVAAHLHIPFQCCCAFQHIFASEEGVGSVFPSHLQHGALYLPFFFQRIIIREEIKLEDSVIIRHVVGADSHPPEQEHVVGLGVKGSQKTL